MNDAQSVSPQPASLPRRLAAMIYDALLVTALLFLTTLPFIALHHGEAVEPGNNRVYQLTLLAVIFVFFVGFWAGKGRTLGMQSWGLCLQDKTGNKPGFGRASLRFFASLLSWLALGLGFVWQLWDQDALTWHDRLSGTRLMHYPKRQP